MKSILLSLFLNCIFFSILTLLELRIDVYLANLLIILVPSITSAILIIFTSKTKLYLWLNVISNLIFYIIYSKYIMHLDGYLSQIIFLFFVYLIPQMIVVFIKHKRGEINARI